MINRLLGHKWHWLALFAFWGFYTVILQLDYEVTYQTVNIDEQVNYEVFRAATELPYKPLLPDLFDGWLLQLKQGGWLNKAEFLFTFALLFISVCGYYLFRKKVFLFVSLVSLAALSCLLALRLSWGTDEFMVNMRHVVMVKEFGFFSVNQHEMLEGSVATLPFFLLGLLGRLGLDLLETSLLAGTLGNVGLVVLVYALGKRLLADEWQGLALAAFMAVFPMVVFQGGMGYMATVFAALLLAAAFFFYFTKYRRTALILFALLTLVRTEGILFTFLFWFYEFNLRQGVVILKENRLLKKSLSMGLLLAAPFLLMTVVRLLAYGQWLPLPVLFKSGGGEWYFIFLGLKQLARVITNYQLYLVFMVIWVSTFLKKPSDDLKKLLLVYGLVTVFSAAYLSGGGNWLPVHWARYLTGFVALSYVVALVLLLRLFDSEIYRWAALLLFLLVSYSVPIPGNAFRAAWYQAQTTPLGWGRLDNLKILGEHLGQSLPEQAIIASPEIATVMHYAERDLLDLVGMTSPIIAAKEPEPFVVFARDSERNLALKKRAPELIKQKKPAVILQWKMYFRRQSFTDELQELKQTVFNGQRQRVAYYRVGSPAKSEALGYGQLVLLTPNRIYTYHLRNDLLEKHRAALSSLGFVSEGRRSIRLPIAGLKNQLVSEE